METQVTPRKKQRLQPLPYPANVPKRRDAIWEPCPICWGQRFIIANDADTGAQVRVTCSACMGLGEITRV